MAGVRRLLSAVAAAALAVACVSAGGGGGIGRAEPAAAAVPDPRPNVVVVMTDDQTVEQMRFLPRTSELIGGNGVTFDQFIVQYPLCCPSRATLLTGQYAHNSGVTTNFGNGAYLGYRSGAQRWAMPAALRRGGYRTAYVGKYLNGYGLGQSAPTEIPAGWDNWRGAPYQWVADYWATRINDNGVLENHAGRYQTDVFRDEALDVIDQEAPRPSPFFLMVSFFAPHTAQPMASDGRLGPEAPPPPAGRHTGLYPHERAPRTPAFNEADISDKPPWVRSLPRLDAADIAAGDAKYRAQARSLAAVDEAVEAIVDRLTAAGEIDNTILMFTSDNGYMHGEHRIPSSKYVPYEESIRVPLLVSGPGVAHGTVDDLAANIDLAPTIADLTGVDLLMTPDGRSLAPALADPGGYDTDRAVLLTNRRANMGSATYDGVRTERWAYAQYPDSEDLYDLAADPHQLDNLAADRPAIAARYRNLTRRLVDCAGVSCQRPPDGFTDANGPITDPTNPNPPAVSWWLTPALWAARTGVLDGPWPAGGFAPDRTLTRQQLARALWVAHGRPAAGPEAGGHPDPAVAWLFSTGAVTHTAETFNAGPAARRALYANWLWRIAGRPAPPAVTPITDIAGHPAADAVAWAHAAGAAVAYPDNTFRPDRGLTRSAAANQLWIRARQTEPARAPLPQPGRTVTG